MTKVKLGTLKQVELRTIWTNEAHDFTPWLAKPENLLLLSDALDLELELEGTEVSVGPYKADVVATDNSTNCKVVIENQLERTNHNHLGQILIYAAGLGAKIIIWIAKEITDEYRQALDYLNENASPDLRFFGIEIQAFQIGNSAPAPYFKVISSPNEYSSTSGGGGRRVTETRALYLEFWQEFRDYLKTSGIPLKPRKPRPQHWYSFAIGRSKFGIHCTVSKMYKRIGVELYIRGENANQAFSLLLDEKEKIEQITGKLEWQELPDKQACRIVVYKKNMDIMDQTKKAAIFEWLKTNTNSFHKAFSKRVKSLPFEDDLNGEEDEITEEE